MYIDSINNVLICIIMYDSMILEVMLLDEIYTPKEVAALLKISERKVNELLRNGEIKASKIGRQWRITEQQLSDFLKENEQK